MRIIDEKGKLFGKCNAIDCLVVILVIVLAFGAYYKFHSLDKTSTGAAMQTVSYKVEIKRVRNYIENNVREGDELFDKTSGKSIGRIVGIDLRPAVENVLGVDGIYRQGAVENRLDVTLLIEADAVVGDGGIFVNRTYELSTGSDRNFMTKYFEGTGKIGEIIL